MERHRRYRLLRAVIAALVLIMLPGLSHATALGLMSEPTVPSEAPAAARCGQVDGGLFGLGGVDPEVLETFVVAGRTYNSADFHLVTLAVFELAWIAHQEVCIDEDAGQQPVGASATVDGCGDVLAGATVWLFQTGSGVLDPNGQTNERRGFIHDTLMGFKSIDFGGQPTPPNFFNAMRVAVDSTEPDDCIKATVSWSAPADPVVAATLSATDCLIAGEIDARVATFVHPVESLTYTFSLTPGSSVASGFEPGVVGGVALTAQRGLEGSVAIAPVAVAGCREAQASPPAPPPSPNPAATPAPTPIPTPSPSPTPTPVPALSPAATVSSTGGAIAAGLETTGPGSGGQPAPTAAVSDLPILALLVVGVLGVAAAGAFWRFGLHRPSPAPAMAGAFGEGAIVQPGPVAPMPIEQVGLTPREREVLAMVAGGLTNREIGAALYISESTAGVHVSNILGKLGVDSRTEAARYALGAGIEPPGPSGPIH